MSNSREEFFLARIAKNEKANAAMAEEIGQLRGLKQEHELGRLFDQLSMNPKWAPLYIASQTDGAEVSFDSISEWAKSNGLPAPRTKQVTLGAS